MRRIIAIVTGTAIALAGCQPSDEAFIADAAQRQAEVFRQAEAKQTLDAFGGTLVGRSEGEWGGEVAFREPDGSTHIVVEDNSQGVFAMPYGIVAITGLSHLGINRGAVYLIYPSADSRVEAELLMNLPGAPCDVIREGDNITMRVHTGYKRLPDHVSRKVRSCYALQPGKELVSYECPVPQEPDICLA